MNKKLFYLILSLLPATCLADKLTIAGQWGGLNNAGIASEDYGTGNDAISISDNESIDLSNIDISDSGTSIRKRKGYDIEFGIGVSTHGVNGGHSFKDSSGVSHLLMTNDRSIYNSTDLLSFSAIVTTDTSGSYYDFADSNGIVYRVTSNRDQFLSYNGSAVTYYPTAPQGNQFEILSDRAAISGTSANPNRIYFSASADFTNYTVGDEETDPFYESVGTIGNQVTAIKAACGGLLIFGRRSIHIWTGTSQYDGRIDKISDLVGTVDPGSVISIEGVTYFYGEDGYMYVYDCNSLTNISRKVSTGMFGDPNNTSRKSAVVDKNGRIWWAIPDYSRTMIYDRRFDAWLVYSFASQGAVRLNINDFGYQEQEMIYFGGVSTYTVCSFPSVDTDDGAAITAYWITKDFSFPNPFVEKDYLSYSFIAASSSGSNLDVSYALAGNSITYTTNNFSLTASASNRRYRNINSKFPAGTSGQYIRFKFGNDDASAPFEFMAFEFDAVPRPWRVLP